MRFTRKRIAVIGAVVAVAAAVAVPLAIGAVTATGTLSHFDKQEHNRLFRDGIGPTGLSRHEGEPRHFRRRGSDSLVRQVHVQEHSRPHRSAATWC